MFRTVAATSFRRALHTSSRSTATASSSRLRVVLGVSAAATTYLTWSALYGQKIALDSAPSSSKKQVPLTPKSAASPDAISHSPSTAATHEPSLHDAHPPELSADDAPPEGVPEGGPDGETEGGGGGGGAFNPETGEINWDCPCLGGMAHGPCGPQFREAFSCFVFSEDEPKGINCVEKFKAMQTCFREHPDVYGDEIMNDDDDDEEFADSPVADGPGSADAPESPSLDAEPSPTKPPKRTEKPRTSPTPTPSES